MHMNKYNFVGPVCWWHSIGQLAFHFVVLLALDLFIFIVVDALSQSSVVQFFEEKCGTSDATEPASGTKTSGRTNNDCFTVTRDKMRQNFNDPAKTFVHSV